MKSADLEAEWQIVPGNSSRPTIASIVPGGSLTFEHRNIARKGRQVRAQLHPHSISACFEDRHSCDDIYKLQH